MRRLLIAAVVALLVSMATPALAGRPGPPGPPDGNNTNAKTQLCHLSETAGYFSIWLSEKGVEKHLEDLHGDVEIGDPVPNMAGYEFDADCQPVLSNRPPVAEDDLFTVTIPCSDGVGVTGCYFGQVLTVEWSDGNVLDNDYDPDGDLLTVSPGSFLAISADGSFFFSFPLEAVEGCFGLSATYIIADPDGATAQAEVIWEVCFVHAY